eukprot:GHVS01012687.1.p1 GENE.GHVS01012687.1~~GHVS01012687.1.p1  ORF type:complete len:884 (+),score=185.01 GHVS01012687.1:168-2819(+)
MSVKLRELIRNIRSSKTAAEERTVISKECALIRTSFKEDVGQYRHRNVAKLLFINMLGYPTHFGQLECLKLIASPKFSDKRVGYLGLTSLLDENAEVLMLVTNSIKNDLNHSNQYINGLALCALANIANEEMCRALSREVEKLLSSSNPYIRKKAALCAMRMIRKVEEIEDKFNHYIAQLLDERSHGVVLGGCALMSSLLDANPSYLPEFRKYVPQMIRSLKSVHTNGYSMAAEYDIAGITDPFLQAKLLRLMRILGKGDSEVSEEVNDMLAQVATNTEGTKNVGNAILYECVQTIMSIESEQGLRVLGINILGRFLQNRDNNIRYVALATLQHVVKVDLKAVQRHRGIIVDCLKDADMSIRKRALDVSCSLINEENIKSMTKELLNFLLAADADFKDDLVMKICIAVDKFAPTRRWHIDTMIKVMCLAGNYVQAEVRDVLIQLIMNTSDLHAYAVTKLFYAMKDNQTQMRLVETALWSVGEFGDLLVSGKNVGPDEQPINLSSSEVVDLLESLHRRTGCFVVPAAGRGCGTGWLVATDAEEMFVTCLVKLTTRLKDQRERLLHMIQKYQKHMSLEIQQRSCEYGEMLGPRWEERALAAVLDRMPVSDRAKSQLEAKLMARTTSVGSGSVRDGLSISPSRRSTGPVGGGDLLDLLDGDSTAAPPPKSAGVAGQHDLLADLLGGLSVAADEGKSSADSSPVKSPPGLVTASPPTPSGSASGGSGGSGSGGSGSGGSGSGGLDLFGGGGGEPSATGATTAFPDVTIFDNDGLCIVFSFSKATTDASKFTVDAVYSNSNAARHISVFMLEVAVPKYLTLQMERASSSIITTAEPIRQRMQVENSQYGQKTILMKIRISYNLSDDNPLVPSKQMQEFLNVSSFPPGL